MPPPPAVHHAALVIAGPTAAGKTEVAIEAALRCGGEIVGADAFQIYEGLDLLTAKPSREQRERVPHHLIGEIPPAESFDVARYLVLAERCMAGIRARGKVPVIVGGTGLYVRALLRGLADLPPADAALRAGLEAEPLAILQERLAVLDPLSTARIDLQNRRRVVRALEVCIITGRPFSSFRDEWAAPPPCESGVVLIHEREELNRRIDRRVLEMFAAGVVEEVARAGDAGPTAGQTLGLREIHAYLAGRMSRAECIDVIQRATRQYAKRQMTWFRKETALRTVLLSPGGPADTAFEALAQIASARSSGECASVR